MVEFPLGFKFRRHDDTVPRQNQELFRLFFETLIGYAILLLDTEGKILSCGPAAEQIIGYRAEEIVGKDMAVFYPGGRI